MTKESIIKIISPTINKQTLYQLSQLKTFMDESIKEVASKTFESDAEKIKYLLDAMHNVRDFSLSLTTENSVRLKILGDMQKLEEETELGNELKKQEEKLSQKIDE